MNIPRKSLRIAILTDDFYPNSGGVARSIELQIRELTAMGHHVTLLAPRTQFTPPSVGKHIAMPVWRLPLTPSYLCSIRFSRRQAEKICRTHRFDIIHSQNERGAMFLGAQLAQMQHIPQVHTFHSNYAGTHKTAPFAAFINSYTFMQLAPKVMKYYCKNKQIEHVRYPEELPNLERTHWAKQDWKSVAKLAQYVDMFTSPARFVIDNINNATRYDLSKSGVVVADGIQTETFLAATRKRPDDGKVRIISSSRLSAEKRIDVLIRAVGMLNRDDIELYIFGEGSERWNLERLARKEVKKGTVHFTGHISDRIRIAQELADGDMFVLASYRFDTQGMTLAESACAGLPIVYCDDRLKIGVSNKNALLTTPSATGLAKALEDLIEHPEKRKRLAGASRDIGKRFTPRAMEERFLEVYHTAIENFDHKK